MESRISLIFFQMLFEIILMTRSNLEKAMGYLDDQMATVFRVEEKMRMIFLKKDWMKEDITELYFNSLIGGELIIDGNEINNYYDEIQQRLKDIEELNKLV